MRNAQYYTVIERSSLIDKALENGEILIGESNLIEGNFLTFCTPNECVPQESPEPTELELLKEKYAILQGAVDFIVMNP